MKSIVAIILIILSVVMFYLSYKVGALPPGITGIGFILIALVFLKEKSAWKKYVILNDDLLFNSTFLQ